MRHLSDLARAVIRFLVVWLVDALSLLATAAILPAITLQGDNTGQIILAAVGAAFGLGVVNVLIRPLILLLARPLGFIVVFVVGFFINGLALLITAWLMPSFTINGLLAAILGGLFFAAVNTVLTNLLDIELEGSFYQAMVERQARQNMFPAEEGALKQGLVMLEIDGLSYHHLQWAIEHGRMPTLTRLIRERDYQLSRFDCGLPSQTSACQAGILYGDNDDIPAYRWYDKEQSRLYISRDDAAEINARFANGQGLVRGGTSIGNLLSGDAKKSLLTLSDLTGGEVAERQARAEDIYLLMLNPYFFTRTLLFFLIDALREIGQAWLSRLRRDWPRINRLKQGYPLLRAASTVLMREISTQLAMLDIIRGAPAIYVTWPGYDEVAHHSGPWSKDALGVLETYDNVVERVLRTIDHKAPRPYDLILLSDHGQSFGATFQQRYGQTLKEFIEEKLPSGTSVTQEMSGRTGSSPITAVSGELDNIAEQGVGGKTGRAVARGGRRILEEGVAQDSSPGASAIPAQVTAYGSGNLAQVYFDLHPRKITLDELSVAYPGVVEALIAHEGIGLVCGYAEDGTPIALGKDGFRNLHTGEGHGADPLLPYAPTDPVVYGYATLATRIWQVRRVMDFPHAGDLMVISSIYPDGTVAALEELIGNHGGLGGEQTDAFLFHPPTIQVGHTRSANDVYHILNARREQIVSPPIPRSADPSEPVREAWSPANLLGGLIQIRTWLTYAAYALVLDRSAYSAVAADIRMTGPALFLGLGVTALSSALRRRAGISAVGVWPALLGWLAAVILVYLTGRALSGRGNFTRTLRAMGFATVTYLIEVLDLLPGFAPLAFFGATAVSFVATWMAAAEAHDISGRRTMLLPFSALFATIIIPLLIMVIFGNARLTFADLFSQFPSLP
jgi:uncharacterized membrane protein YvlD (DUF360 family)